MRYAVMQFITAAIARIIRRNDWMLKVVYRTSAAAYDIAGLQPVELDHERMLNVDLTDLISGTYPIYIFIRGKIDTRLDHAKSVSCYLVLLIDAHVTS